LGLAKSDLTVTKASFTSLLSSLNVSTVQVDNYIAALQSYLAVVVATPTQAQKDAMTAKLDLFDTAEVAFIQSFQGLSNIADVFFVAEPKNSVFNGLRIQSSIAKTTLRTSPEQTYSFFTDLATATKFAEYTVEAIKVSDRIKSGA
jgi:hypothetical protein